MKKFSIFLFLGLCCIMYAQSQQLFTKDKSYSTENSSNFKTLSSVLNYDGENYDAVGMQNMANMEHTRISHHRHFLALTANILRL